MRIETLAHVFEKWLTADNEYVQQAIDRTIEEGYFSFEDVKYAILALKKNLNKEALEKWVKCSNMSDEHDARDQNVLCLHAGNLPLVGFQDALAVLLSGARYTGKISRKDPYLLPTFLNEIKNTKIWRAQDVQWSHHLDDFEDMQNDAILFAGSEQSVPGVKDAIKRFNLKKQNSRYLVRTAHFSMAYLKDQEKRNMENLVEAIFRYDGKGCRSVAVVVSPYALEEIQDDLKHYAEVFRMKNPQHQKPKPKLKQRFAYNKAVGRKQLWLDDFLVQERGLELDQDFICYWVQGDETKASELASDFGKQLQSIYITHSHQTIPGCEDRLEYLPDAQRPPVFWKPDGTDTLAWLCRRDDV